MFNYLILKIKIYNSNLYDLHKHLIIVFKTKVDVLGKLLTSESSSIFSSIT